ncbi:MAG: hypothetical protein NZ516_12040 [Raineya sp.]|nr:hypothetical protein [Raineya sp.]
MKTICILLQISIALMAFKCNTNWRERKNRKILVQGYVLNEQRVYHLGDTIYFEVVIPDTITIQDNNTNTIELY